MGVKGISDIITKPGLVNVDFADVRSVMAQAGTALLGIGVGSGRSRASEAAQAAMTSPLLESARIDGAKGCVINISGGKDMTLEDMTTASEVIFDVVDPDANIIVGAVVDESLEGEIHVTVIATGFDSASPYRSQRPASIGTSPFAPRASLNDSGEDKGAMIPPFLLNRQGNRQE
jgi:cell division protein FtsZ